MFRDDRALSDRDKIAIALGLLRCKKRGRIFNVWINSDIVRIQRSDYDRRGNPLYPISISWRAAKELANK